ncbi:histidine--tRNA ligase [Pseudostreptobacillus hongkongensis]|uniref:histidine--tRNA ligase n=1 Tax=Pseudostreptobacillus hongkongensis TaxID=1162717 RepID=UPI0008320F78|nr:histidine--tRNA ligase [Pseudostreptobacillus hongkongensis]
MKFDTLKGMKDTYFDDMAKYEYIINTAKEIFSKYSYDRVMTPILEETSLFKRAVGDETDVVSKEMYTFIDKGDRSVTLRPEGTAGVVRAYLNAGLHKSNPNVKWYYYGPMYRYEAPQKGRYREFHQVGIESLGIRTPLIDAEIIKMACEFLEKLGINDLVVEVNSLGNIDSRFRYIEELKKYLKVNFDGLSNDSKIRSDKNPLRVLDSKDENDQKILLNAPMLHDFFDEESNKYFEDLKYYLEKFEINYVVNQKLVRGLDYYSDTVFEVKSSKLGAQSTVLAGGRYDRLTEILADVKIPGIGFAAGIERLSLLIDDELIKKENKKIFVIYFEETKDYFINTLNTLRKHNINVEFEYAPKGFGTQMKKANKIDAKYVLILGEDEMKNNKLSIKNFEDGSQEILTIDEVIERIK